jgi:hypothetical protein
MPTPSGWRAPGRTLKGRPVGRAPTARHASCQPWQGQEWHGQDVVQVHQRRLGLPDRLQPLRDRDLLHLKRLAQLREHHCGSGGHPGMWPPSPAG